MQPHSDLPAPLRGAPFSIAEARNAGVGRGRLRGSDLDRPFYGVRANGMYTLARAYAARLRPGDRFSHTTAAELWGAPLPTGLPPGIHVTAPPELTRPRGRGVRGHAGGATRTSSRSGLPVSDPITMYLELTTLLGIDDLVAVGDYLVLDPRVLDPHDLRPYVTLEELRAAVGMASGRGIRAARSAAALVRTGVESPMETRLRLLVVRAGLPEPVCGFELTDSRGRSVGWFDLAWPEWRVLAEYDGDGHRTSTEQYERDIRRFDQADELGWRVIRVRLHGIRNPDATNHRIARALLRGGWPGASPRGRRST